MRATDPPLAWESPEQSAARVAEAGSDSLDSLQHEHLRSDHDGPGFVAERDDDSAQVTLPMAELLELRDTTAALSARVQRLIVAETATPNLERERFDGGGGSDVVEPFRRHPYRLPLGMAGKANQGLTECVAAAELDRLVSPLCGAVVDLTGGLDHPPFAAIHPFEMLYVASLAKIYALYAAFELRQRVEAQTKAMIANGLSTSDAGWENRVFTQLAKAWAPKLNAAFPRLPRGLPSFANIFALSSSGAATFIERSPRPTDAELDVITDKGAIPNDYRFGDRLRLMLRWSHNTAASNCIRALSYPYINGTLAAGGFFDTVSKTGLWLSGDYQDNDWLKHDRAGQRLSPRWAKLQHRTVSNFTGTAFQIARLITVLGQGRLVDPTSSSAMISLLTGNDGIGSYIAGGLRNASPPRAFSSVASKIGLGNDRFKHDCAIVRVERGGDPMRTFTYVSVVLGASPAHALPDGARKDLRKLAVMFHDCITALHP